MKLKTKPFGYLFVSHGVLCRTSEQTSQIYLLNGHKIHKFIFSLANGFCLFIAKFYVSFGFVFCFHLFDFYSILCAANTTHLTFYKNMKWFFCTILIFYSILLSCMVFSNFFLLLVWDGHTVFFFV